MRLRRRDQGPSNGVFCSKLLCFRAGHAAVNSGNVHLLWAYGNVFTEMGGASSKFIVSSICASRRAQITRREDEW